VAETKGEVAKIQEEKGGSPVAYLDSIGVLRDRTLAVHAVWASEEDTALLAAQGVGVSVTTESEMKLASGVAPIPGFLDAGLSVGLGTDGCASNNNQDMFQEMDFTAKLHKVHRLDPTVLHARSVLALATRDAAAAIGLGDEIGSIEVGKWADIITIDTKQPHWTPMYDPNSHLVYTARGSDVRNVVVDGTIVVENRRIRTMDVERVTEDVEGWSRKIRSSK
jgi:5-methylthioadenosine/S-adenosylhomocysteine deaminase